MCVWLCIPLFVRYKRVCVCRLLSLFFSLFSILYVNVKNALIKKNFKKNIWKIRAIYHRFDGIFDGLETKLIDSIFDSKRGCLGNQNPKKLRSRYPTTKLLNLLLKLGKMQEYAKQIAQWTLSTF